MAAEIGVDAEADAGIGVGVEVDIEVEAETRIGIEERGGTVTTDVEGNTVTEAGKAIPERVPVAGSGAGAVMTEVSRRRVAGLSSKWGLSGLVYWEGNTQTEEGVRSGGTQHRRRKKEFIF